MIKKTKKWSDCVHRFALRIKWGLCVRGGEWGYFVHGKSQGLCEVVPLPGSESEALKKEGALGLQELHFQGDSTLLCRMFPLGEAG